MSATGEEEPSPQGTETEVPHEETVEVLPEGEPETQDEPLLEAESSESSGFEPSGEPAAVVEAQAPLEATPEEAVADVTLVEEDAVSQDTAVEDGQSVAESPHTAEAEEPEEAVDPESDRRQTGRKGVKLNRLIASRVVDGESHRECYLHLVDISEGGLRVNSDDPFPDDRPFTLDVGLAAFGTELATRKPRMTFPVRVVWTKSLVGGMVVSGLAFGELDKEREEIVAAIMKGASPQGRRQHFRLNRVLGVELGAAGEERWLYPLTLDLSVEGMRICLSETLEVGAKFPIKIFLEFELPTIEAVAEVMWQEVMPSGRVQIGLKFDALTERDAMAIKTYIDQCLEQDQSHRSL